MLRYSVESENDCPCMTVYLSFVVVGVDIPFQSPIWVIESCEADYIYTFVE